jgi:hypothetical protein
MAETLQARIAALDWPRIAAELDSQGCATTGALLTPAECGALAALYDATDPALFRARVVMARHGFGRGEYRYFAVPVPDAIATMRSALYAQLAPVAEAWRIALGGAGASFPADHAEYLARCHAAGQRRPTPVLLSYGPGDYNCLHQDLYGELAFPLQATILLSAPDADFTGGEFVLTEQRPRRQSRAEVVPLRQGEAVIFAVSQRPVQGSRGTYRVAMRHGVSRLRGGLRRSLGLIFHDAG